VPSHHPEGWDRSHKEAANSMRDRAVLVARIVISILFAAGLSFEYLR
jgi:hypothetical protein